MSVHVMAWLFDHAPHDLAPSEMLVALVLADSANLMDGYVTVPTDALLRMTRLSPEGLHAAIDGLVGAGVLTQTTAEVAGWHAGYCFLAFNDPTCARPLPGPNAARGGAAHQAWRRDVIGRDGGSCRVCSATDDLHAHHIQPWATYPELRFDVDNGQTLCGDCHREAHRGRRR